MDDETRIGVWASVIGIFFLSIALLLPTFIVIGLLAGFLTGGLIKLNCMTANALNKR